MTDTDSLTDEQVDAHLEAERAAEQAASEASAEQEQETPETPSDEAEGTSEDQGGDDQPDDRKVPYGALREEREKRKAAQAENQQLSEKLGRIEALISEMQKRQQPAEEQKPQGPQFDDDPIQYLKARQDAHDAHQRQMEAQQQFVGALHQREEAFRQQNPDYDQAVAFAKASRIQELQAMGYPNAPEIVNREAVALAADLMRQGRNPAEGFYAYSKARGYQTATQPPANQQIDKTAAREQTRSLGTGGGKPPRGKYTLEQLAAMSPDDPNFDVAFNAVMGAS